MSKPGEHRRVPFTTISTQRSSISNNDAGFGAMPSSFTRFGDIMETDPLQNSNKGGKPADTKTVRLELELFETDSNRYPEFNYSKLVYLEKKKAKMLKTKVASNPDPFADNDDDVERIAKELEAKYGNSYARGRGRRRKDEFCDIGMGYDESDSFIDNTEAYDEILPEEVETLEGGFYINCGALEFKNLQKKSHTRRTDAIIKMPERSRKRILSTSSEDSSDSSSESSTETEQEPGAHASKNKKNNANDDNDDEAEDDDDDDEDTSDSDSESLNDTDSESESLDDDNESGTSTQVKNKLKGDDDAEQRKSTSTVKKRPSSVNAKKSSSKLTSTTSSSSNSPRPSAHNSDAEERQAQALKKVVKTTTVKDMLKAKRDSFLKSQGQDGAVKLPNGEIKVTSINVESSSDDDNTDSASEHSKADKQPKGVDNLRPADTILPATLDKEIVALINNFKEIVRSRDLCGKRFSFDSNLTALLLKIYEALLCTERNERNMVFAHLEYQLQLPKYFILRKAKVLRAREEKIKTSIALDKLRKAVTEAMPKAVANYELELHKFAELASADVNAEHPPEMPIKKFQWTPELRERLYEVYQARWTSYVVLGKRKDSLEQFITGYLKDKILDVWAAGWMRIEELQREIERHKNSSKKLKSRKSTPAVIMTPPTVAAAPTTPTPPPITTTVAAPAAAITTATANNCVKDELVLLNGQSRSRANSDTDSVKSASSQSLKRKLDNGAAQPKPSAKPPKIKFQKQLAATLAQMAKANSPTPPPQPLQPTLPTPTPVSIDQLSLPDITNYLMQFDEQLTITTQQLQQQPIDATKSSLKRKLEKAATAAPLRQNSKPPKKKFQQQQQQASPQLDTFLGQPSTSAQAAALNAAAVAAAASMLELASPTKQTDHSIYSIMTAAISAATTSTTMNINPSINSQVQHSTASVLTGAKPIAHVINLDDYKSPSDILQTSKQLAAAKWPATVLPSAGPTPVVRCESSSESDGVEIVSVYTAKPQKQSKPRNKTQHKFKGSTAAPTVNGLNGALGYALENMYVYNNNNNNNKNNNNASNSNIKTNAVNSVIRTTVGNNIKRASQIGYDLSRDPQLMQQLSELSALEKQLKWTPQTYLSNAGAGAASSSSTTNQ
ncbi:yemalpha [Drosophila busckii]|uniref:Yemalpha n=1 Tax=Drosophila busckii TaxID=30019 RepID=A0A0M3QXR8_DROBS|nr:yemanuclein [Drosophila busckii]ALC46403.1 yemalpha [Drosophila busckii]